MSARRFWNELWSNSRDYTVSKFLTWSNSVEFGSVEAFCLFVGYPRSGHSLVGSLLDAHPDIVIAHEQDILKYTAFPFFRDRFTREQLFHLLLRNARRQGMQGRQWRDYQYAVPNQFQGRIRECRVIGDKKGGRSTWRIMRKAGSLEKLTRIVRVPVKFVHVVRNPFDNVSTMASRWRKSLRRTVQHYARLCETNADLRARSAAECWIELRHEDLVSDPEAELARLCRFFDVRADPTYLADCASIVNRTPNRSRHKAKWTPELIGEVQSVIDRFDFLRGYDFEN